MADASSQDRGLAVPLHERSSKFTWIWLAPIAAALIAIWLVYTTFSERGPLVTILFDEATGLEAGKTALKFKDVKIGQVEAVQISGDLQKIVVKSRMVKGFEKFLNDGAKFWIVRPRVGTGGVSGLDTLVSGAYVAFDPGDGEPTREFRGLEEPPLIRSDVPGTRFSLRAESLAGLSRGSLIYHRGLEVGNVLGYELRDKADDLLVYVFIHSPYDKLVTNNTRFWNASGINLVAGAEGFGLQVESIQAVLTGGIAFVNSGGDATTVRAAAGSQFKLYSNAIDAIETEFDERLPFIVNFEGSIRGLRKGAPVEIKGLKIGEVTSIDLQLDPGTGDIKTPVQIEIEPQRFTLIGKQTDATRQRYSIINTLISGGLRAQLATGSLITGDLIVNLIYTNDRSIDELDMSTDPPTLPSVPSELDVLTASLSGLLNKIAALPIESMVEEVMGAVGAARGLIESPDLAKAIDGLNQAMVDLEGLMREVRGEAGPLIRSLQAATTQAELAIQETTTLITAAEGQVGPESQFSYDLTQLMQELSAAARSVRNFADYLERNPQALLRGKQGGFQ